MHKNWTLLILVTMLALLLGACATQGEPRVPRNAQERQAQTVPTTVPVATVAPLVEVTTIVATEAPTAIPTESSEVWYIIAGSGDCRNAIYGVAPDTASFECKITKGTLFTWCLGTDPNTGLPLCEHWEQPEDATITLGSVGTGRMGTCTEWETPAADGTMLTLAAVFIDPAWMPLWQPCRGWHN
jgi:hypothetical protein